jgi:hypothetical protein
MWAGRALKLAVRPLSALSLVVPLLGVLGVLGTHAIGDADMRS